MAWSEAVPGEAIHIYIPLSQEPSIMGPPTTHTHPGARLAGVLPRSNYQHSASDLPHRLRVSLSY